MNVELFPGEIFFFFFFLKSIYLEIYETIVA